MNTDCSSGEACGHKLLRPQCVSCRAFDWREEQKKAEAQAARHEETAQGLAAVLAAGNMSREDQEDREAKESKAKQLAVAWRARAEGLQKEADVLAGQVKAVLGAATTPEDRAKAFDDNAVEREAAADDFWLAHSLDKKEARPFEPARLEPLAFRGRDYSNVPATPDCLVKEGRGLEVFLRRRGTTGAPPTQALGGHSGPAIMSYGRALATLPPKLEESEESSEIKWPGSLANQVAKLSLETGAGVQAGSFNTPTAPKLSEEEQWGLFKVGKLLPEVAITCSQYTKLQARLAKAEKQWQARKEEAESDGKPFVETKEEAFANVMKDCRGWPAPAATGPDFPGYTNWVNDLKKADKKLGSATLKNWRAERENRVKAVEKNLTAWHPPENVNQRFNHPDPKEFFNQPKMLALSDLKRMGFKYEESKP